MNRKHLVYLFICLTVSIMLDDVNAVMWIWGPGDDDKTYNVEIARLAGNKLEITYPRGKMTFPANSNEGYFGFTVTG